ncbi:uncharacterized protein LOC113941887 [Corapipo altera]|uniref:uncharacterized protein LOC113941887 n=1 Tax=Corapipo altera TaxID=415028 RepID=UPI000FD637BE|nr:uncharacterized protein LOC113941887 [Corapipo altera]
MEAVGGTETTWGRLSNPWKVKELCGKGAVWGGVGRERQGGHWNSQLSIWGAAELLVINGTGSRVWIGPFSCLEEKSQGENRVGDLQWEGWGTHCKCSFYLVAGLCFFERTPRSHVYYFDDGVELSGLPTTKLDAVNTEVKQHYWIFSELLPDLRVMFLNTITAVMRDRNLFQELSQNMEGVLEKTDGYELKTESPDLKDLFSTLKNSPRDRRLLLAKGITYTLDALAELLDHQLLLLLESLERKIVSQQLQLVGKLLEYKQKKVDMPFHVDASLLSFLPQEDQSLTMALVELSRVKLQEDGSAVPMERPFEVVAALYVALYTLSLLSGPK